MKRSWKENSYEEWHGTGEWFPKGPAEKLPEASGPAEMLPEFHKHLILISFGKVFLKNILKCDLKKYRFKGVLYWIIIHWSYHNEVNSFSYRSEKSFSC